MKTILILLLFTVCACSNSTQPSPSASNNGSYVGVWASSAYPGPVINGNYILTIVSADSAFMRYRLDSSINVATKVSIADSAIIVFRHVEMYDLMLSGDSLTGYQISLLKGALTLPVLFIRIQ